ncbi:ATP-dependent Clp protease proteolytic subunit [Thermomonospora umbrina]|uniref:ATP-dependent Clp protease proteolytic subunit n=1 Tax=Thermomonospora umbrina TaxID=111806 RepID=A0A3D9SZ99_9ACTN|nr:ATP-dependent Clp protease proteolytic subunit [Thermomonospora umbrina]REF00908.1 ATP-dependent Clp protease proteolytic subunit ClpP [Thermomonospora umbrina]
MTPGPRGEVRPPPPSFVERTAYGVTETDPYGRLFADRIVLLGTPIDDTAANDVISQLLALENRDPDRPIALYINSPGGSLTAMTAIYDTMRYIRAEVETTCIGQAASAAAVLLAAGTAGRRAALGHARILLHQPAVQGTRGSADDLEIQAREALRARAAMEEIIARHTGRDPERVRADIERNRFLTAAEAREYGLVDEVLTARRRPGG